MCSLQLDESHVRDPTVSCLFANQSEATALERRMLRISCGLERVSLPRSFRHPRYKSCAIACGADIRGSVNFITRIDMGSVLTRYG